MRRLLVCIVVVIPFQTVADDTQGPSPGLEMLEYLGEWQHDDDEQWIDPVGLYAAGLLGGRPGRPKTSAPQPMHPDQERR